MGTVRYLDNVNDTTPSFGTYIFSLQMEIALYVDAFKTLGRFHGTKWMTERYSKED